MNRDQAYLKLANALKRSPIIPPCQNTDPEIWFGDKDEGYHYTNMARKLCGMCPAMQACSEYAIIAIEDHGVWGGLTPRERQNIRAGKPGRPKAA